MNHSKEEYVRGDAYTNTLEGYFSVFKRGMKGVYQHCDEQHLQRYLAEFDFRYSNRVDLRACPDEFFWVDFSCYIRLCLYGLHASDHWIRKQCC